MPLEPTHPGAIPEARLTITKSQALRLSQTVEEYLAEHRLDSVRLENMRDAWLRVVFIGPEGDPAAERYLAPV